MSKRSALIVITLALMIPACSTNTFQPPPAWALGDSPTLSGTITNLAEAKVEGTSLVVKAKIRKGSGEEKIIAEANVTAAGAFSLKLPGVSTLAADLEEITTTLPLQYTCTDVTLSPKTYKGILLSLFLYSNNQPVGGGGSLLYTNGDLIIGYVLLDRDVITKYKCSFETAKNDADLDLKKGWNSFLTVLFPGPKPAKTYSGVPDSSYTWLAPVEQIPAPSVVRNVAPGFALPY